MRVVETAIFKTEKVDQDQVLTRDRPDWLETRVTALESLRAPKPRR